MNWYKQAFEIENFKDRNLINERIKNLSLIAQNLYAIKENAMQNPAAAKKYLDGISSNKIFTSYPSIQTHFNTISSKMLDNPKQSTDIIDEVIRLIVAKVDDLKQERTNFTEKVLPKKLSF